MRKLDQVLNHSKNTRGAVNMEVGKKIKDVAKDHLLPKEFQKLILPYLQEATFKAEKIKVSDFEASNVELTCKFYEPKPKVRETQEIKKVSTWERLKLFILEQSIIAYFQFINMDHHQFFLYIIFSILSLVLVS